MELPTLLEGNSLGMQLGIDRVGSLLVGVQVAPQCGERVVVLSSTKRTRAVSSRPRGHLVEEEELGEKSRLHHRSAVPPTKLELAGNPAFAVEPAPDAATIVVQATSIPVHQSASGVGNEIAKGSDSILQWH
jgi:hypothetical protein